MDPVTAFALPPLVVDYDAHWVEVDLRGDAGQWAQRAAAEVLARSGEQARRTDARQLAKLFAAAGSIARRAQDATISLLLYPGPEFGVQAIARFCPVDLSGQDGDDAWAGLESIAVVDLPGQEPPEITELDTAAGPCRRVRQLVADGDQPERPVSEHLAYLWLFPDYGAGVILVTAFSDLVRAGRWRPVLDDLATTGVTLRQPGE